MSERRIQSPMNTHPWWSAPGRRLEMCRFDNYHSLVSAEWKGRERDWFASIMRVGTVAYYGTLVSTPSILEVYPASGFHISEISHAGDNTDNGTWSVSAIVASEESKHDLLADLNEKKDVIINKVTIDESPSRALDMIPSDSKDIVYSFESMAQMKSDQEQSEILLAMHRITKLEGIVIASFRLRIPSIYNAIIRSDTWHTEDELNELVLFSNPKQYGTMHTPSLLEDVNYTSMADIESMFADIGLDLIDVVPCDTIWQSLGDATTKRLVSLGASAVNIICTAIAIIHEANMASCLSSEVVCVGQKVK